jgi:cysteine/O-acetylserine efflux protein
MANLYPFLSYVFVTTFTPGPNNVLAMSNGMRYGYRNILKFLLGIFSGFSLLMLLCGLLNFALVSLLPQVEFGLKIAGAVYMVYLAVHILRSKPAEDTQSTKDLNTFWAGFTLQFVNLKGILYGVTVYSTFIVPSHPGALVLSLYAPLLAGICFLATTCWALGGNLFSSFLKKYTFWFNLAMAALLVYTAVASLIQ